MSKYQYRVDAADVLTWVDPWWLAFARENGAEELTKENVLGLSLWDFISDADTRGLYVELHHRIRVTGDRIVLPFRCDSPTVRRHMRMVIGRTNGGSLLYECTLLKVEQCAPLGVLDREFPRSGDFLTICSCCRRSLVEPVGWLEVEDAVVRLRLLEEKTAPPLRYTVCPDCSVAS